MSAEAPTPARSSPIATGNVAFAPVCASPDSAVAVVAVPVVPVVPVAPIVPVVPVVPPPVVPVESAVNVIEASSLTVT
jgi:hypothetical protein